MRTTRGAYRVLYDHAETFHVGGSKTLRSTQTDSITLIGAGVTVYECLAAADRLAQHGIRARVIDLYSIKPIDVAAVSAAAAATRGRFVLVEDHHPEGGLGSAIIEALVAARIPSLRIAHLSVRELPGSGTTSELLHAAGIDAEHIESAARGLLDAGHS
jgi:transketolase